MGDLVGTILIKLWGQAPPLNNMKFKGESDPNFSCNFSSCFLSNKVVRHNIIIWLKKKFNKN